MDFKTEGNLVLSVSLGQNKQWEVSSQESSRPLASFDKPQGACAWAIAFAKPRRGQVLVEQVAASSAASSHAVRSAPQTFKFSIPVTWTDSRDLRFKSARG